MVKRENPLTTQQQLLVESHMNLVDTVIRTRIQTNEGVCGLGYEDLKQEGCMLLCKAVQTYDPSRAKLSTYASKVIYNGLISHCRKINRDSSRLSLISLDECEDRLLTKDALETDPLTAHVAAMELQELITAYAKEYTGVSRLGIEALLLRTNGVSITELGRLYQVPPSHVGAWISRAVKKLRTNEKFLKEIA